MAWTTLHFQFPSPSFNQLIYVSGFLCGFRMDGSRSPSSPLAVPIQAPTSPAATFSNRTHHGTSRASSVASYNSESNRSGQHTCTPSPLPSFGSGSESENEIDDEDSQDTCGDNSNDA